MILINHNGSNSDTLQKPLELKEVKIISSKILIANKDYDQVEITKCQSLLLKEMQLIEDTIVSVMLTVLDNCYLLGISCLWASASEPLVIDK